MDGYQFVDGVDVQTPNLLNGVVSCSSGYSFVPVVPANNSTNNATSRERETPVPLGANVTDLFSRGSRVNTKHIGMAFVPLLVAPVRRGVQLRTGVNQRARHGGGRLLLGRR